MNLNGKNVLLIAPKFFGYEKEIASEFIRRGAIVDLLLDRPFNTPLMTAVTRFARFAIMAAVDRLYEDQIETFGRSSYDLIFVVNGQTVSNEFLANLRRNYPRARLVLYLWDSIANRRSTVKNLALFDNVFSFDRRDAATFGLQLRPLFFTRGFEAQPAQQDLDISFIGTAHTDRAKIVHNVDQSLPVGARRFWYLYLQAPWVFSAYKVTNRSFDDARFEQFSFEPLPKSTVQSVFARSACVLDIEHPRQIGLTMRTIEVFGAAKKLVTTNREVREYDFYNPANIAVLDRSDASVPHDFLALPYVPSKPAIYRKYRLEGWADEILASVSPTRA